LRISDIKNRPQSCTIYTPYKKDPNATVTVLPEIDPVDFLS